MLGKVRHAQASIAVRSRTKLIAVMVNRVLTEKQVERLPELKNLPRNPTVGSPRLSAELLDTGSQARSTRETPAG